MLKSKLVVWTFIVVTGFYMLVSIWNMAVFPDKTWTDYTRTDFDCSFWKYGEWLLIAAFFMYAAAMLVKYINGG